MKPLTQGPNSVQMIMEQSQGILKKRGLVRITGKDAHDLLQNLLTSDLNRLKDGPVYTGLLTPQGKVLFDMIFWQSPLGMIAETAADRVPDLIKRLTMYKLRAEMVIEDASDTFAVSASLTPEPGYSQDPRNSAMPMRALVTQPADLPAIDDAYDAARIKCGIAELDDFDIDGTFWLETGAREQGGVDFDKGCYVGQEQTARMNYRGTLKKGFIPFAADGALPERGTPITAEGRTLGDTRSAADGHLLGFVRFEKLQDAIEAGHTIMAGDTKLTKLAND